MCLITIWILTLYVDTGLPKKFNRRDGKDGKLKFKSKKFEKGNAKPGKIDIKQMKRKQLPAKLSRKRKLQDGSEG